MAKALDSGQIRGARLVALSDENRVRASELSRKLRSRPAVLTVDALIGRCDLVVEAAHLSAVAPLLKKVIQKRKDLLVMSTGGLLGQKRLLAKAKERGCSILIPSGALSGIDGVKAASLLPIRKMVLTTRKPPHSFEGAPFVLKRKINLKRIRRATVLFRGNFRKALAAFPQNINVAATLALAGRARQLEVRVVADPKARRNSHEVVLEGSAGTLKTICENLPSRENPRTSRLATLSAIAALKTFLDSVKVGT